MSYIHNTKHKGRLWCLISIGLALLFIAFLTPLSSKSVNNIFYTLVLLPLLATLIVTRGPQVSTGKLFGIFLCFISLSAIPIVQSGNFQGIRHLLYTTVFWVAVSTVTCRHKEKLNSALKASCALVLLFTVTLLFIHFVINESSFSVRPNFWASWRSGNPITVSMFVALHCMMFSTLAYQQGKRYTAIGTFALAIILMLAYQTKTGIFGSIVAIVITVIFEVSKNNISKKQLLEFSLGATIFIVLTFLLYLSGALDSVLSRGGSYRLEIYNLIINEYIECGALMGCGYEYEIKSTLHNGEVLAHTHSVYLAQLLFLGLPSLIILVIIQIRGFYLARSLSRPISVGIIVSAAFLLVDGGAPINNPDPVWIFLWLPLAIVDGLSSENKLTSLDNPKYDA